MIRISDRHRGGIKEKYVLWNPAAVHIYSILLYKSSKGHIMRPKCHRESYKIEPSDISKSKHFS